MIIKLDRFLKNALQLLSTFLRLAPLHIQGGPKKAPFLFFLPNVWFRRFCFIFQVVNTVGLGNCLDSKMDVSGRYTVQQRIKIIEAYFATKSVILTQ